MCSSIFWMMNLAFQRSSGSNPCPLSHFRVSFDNAAVSAGLVCSSLTAALLIALKFDEIRKSAHLSFFISKLSLSFLSSNFGALPTILGPLLSRFWVAWQALNVFVFCCRVGFPDWTDSLGSFVPSVPWGFASCSSACSADLRLLGSPGWGTAAPVERVRQHFCHSEGRCCFWRCPWRCQHCWGWVGHCFCWLPSWLVTLLSLM